LNLSIVEAHWDDILRVAGSLMLGRVAASDLVRVLQSGGRPTALGRAIAEVGRVPKTVHLLTYSGDESYRRRILVQLNRHESRHPTLTEAPGSWAHKCRDSHDNARITAWGSCY